MSADKPEPTMAELLSQIDEAAAELHAIRKRGGQYFVRIPKWLRGKAYRKFRGMGLQAAQVESRHYLFPLGVVATRTGIPEQTRGTGEDGNPVEYKCWKCGQWRPMSCGGTDNEWCDFCWREKIKAGRAFKKSQAVYARLAGRIKRRFGLSIDGPIRGLVGAIEADVDRRVMRELVEWAKGGDLAESAPVNLPTVSETVDEIVRWGNGVRRGLGLSVKGEPDHTDAVDATVFALSEAKVAAYQKELVKRMVGFGGVDLAPPRDCDSGLKVKP